LYRHEFSRRSNFTASPYFSFLMVVYNKTATKKKVMLPIITLMKDTLDAEVSELLCSVFNTDHHSSPEDK
jgi:hypothetical protein